MRVGQQQPQLIGASLVTCRKVCMHAHLQQHQTQLIGAFLASHAEATLTGIYSSFNLSVFCDMYKWTFGAASIFLWSVTHRGRYKHLQQSWQMYVVWHAEVCRSFYSWSSQAEPGCQWCSHQLVRRLASCKEVRGGSFHALHNYLFSFSLHICSFLMKPWFALLQCEPYCFTRLLFP